MLGCLAAFLFVNLVIFAYTKEDYSKCIHLEEGKPLPSVVAHPVGKRFLYTVNEGGMFCESGDLDPTKPITN